MPPFILHPSSFVLPPEASGRWRSRERQPGGEDVGGVDAAVPPARAEATVLAHAIRRRATESIRSSISNGRSRQMAAPCALARLTMSRSAIPMSPITGPVASALRLKNFGPRRLQDGYFPDRQASFRTR